MSNNTLFAGCCLAVSLLLNVSDAVALPIVYEAMPTVNSGFRSYHDSGGPVVADDFIPEISGDLAGIEWWGASTWGGITRWAISIHENFFDATQNEWEPSSPFISQYFVDALGTDINGDGIFHYQINWDAGNVVLNAGSSYWLSIANCDVELWTWAFASDASGTPPPTTGAELYGGMYSVGDSSLPWGSSPQVGPWAPLPGSPGFAFRISAEPKGAAAPEPSTMLLCATGLTGLAMLRRKTWRMWK